MPKACCSDGPFTPRQRRTLHEALADTGDRPSHGHGRRHGYRPDTGYRQQLARQARVPRAQGDLRPRVQAAQGRHGCSRGEDQRTAQGEAAEPGPQDRGRDLQHSPVTVVHVHSADPTTPRKMLDALPKVPPVVTITLKDFYTTEASKGAGRPWWLDLGIVKSGQSFEDMMAYNTVATAALTPFRDGPLPRCTGPVFANMSDAAKELTRI